MRLKKAQVENFRCIEDSEEFRVDQVTYLVGKNESGKTALLEALYKINPVESDQEDFDELDFPRRHLTKARDGTEPDVANVVTTTWELSDEDRDAVNQGLGGEVLTDNEVFARKGYDNQLEWEFSIDEGALCDELINQANFNAPEGSPFRETRTIAELSVALEGLAAPTEKQSALLGVLSEKFPESVDATAGQILVDSKRLPRFVYYDQYFTLPGFVSLSDLKIRRDGVDPALRLRRKDKVFLALLDMTSSSLDEIEKIGKSEKLFMEMEAIQNHLTDEIFEYWSQNQHLEVSFSLDAARPDDPPPFNEGWCFSTRIKNRRHRATVNFDKRSSGFVWFFSFLVWFSQVKRKFGENLVLLLDEPGLSLHGKAQQDLLRYFNERLRPNHQLIYTTHSPFMIDPPNIFSLRTVEDVVKTDGEGKQEILGTKVGEQIWARDKDTLFPLQGILGFEIAQTMFVGPNVLVVEGPSEAAAIHWVSRQLVASGRPGLDLRWAVCPAEGAAKVSSFVTLFRGRGLKIAALLDYHDGQKGLVDKLEASELLDAGLLLRVTDFVDQDEADIEDVLGRDFYRDLVNRALELSDAHKLPEDRPEGAPERVLKEAERHCATLPPAYREFDHFLPFRLLVQLDTDEISQLQGLEDALDRFQLIFDQLNKLV